MKIFFCRKLFKPIPIFVFLISVFSLKGNFLCAEFLPEDIQMDNSTKSEEDSSVIPTNPFEIVEMIRRHNSLNDATNPTDALDDALKSFNSLEENKEFIR